MKRKLTGKEILAGEAGIKDLKKRIEWAKADLDIFKVKMKYWGITEEKFQEQIKTQKAILERNIQDCEMTIKESPKIIKQIEDQIKNGVEIKDEKSNKERSKI